MIRLVAHEIQVFNVHFSSFSFCSFASCIFWSTLRTEINFATVFSSSCNVWYVLWALDFASSNFVVRPLSFGYAFVCHPCCLIIVFNSFGVMTSIGYSSFFSFFGSSNLWSIFDGSFAYLWHTITLRIFLAFCFNKTYWRSLWSCFREDFLDCMVM